jgi:hypothetical protein
VWITRSTHASPQQGNTLSDAKTCSPGHPKKVPGLFVVGPAGRIHLGVKVPYAPGKRKR